jgi:hypothetical protein
MTTLHVTLGAHEAAFTAGQPAATYLVPVGTETLAAMIAHDPPLPEELLNAIGTFMDHLEDVTREVPSSIGVSTIDVAGPGVQALVDTEAGRPTSLPCTLTRDSVEEVFRTLATETAADRALNPGLPNGEVHHLLGVCCAVVATLRGVQATMLTVVGAQVTR